MYTYIADADVRLKNNLGLITSIKPVNQMLRAKTDYAIINWPSLY